MSEPTRTPEQITLAIKGARSQRSKNISNHSAQVYEGIMIALGWIQGENQFMLELCMTAGQDPDWDQGLDDIEDLEEVA